MNDGHSQFYLKFNHIKKQHKLSSLLFDQLSTRRVFKVDNDVDDEIEVVVSNTRVAVVRWSIVRLKLLNILS